MHFILFIEMIYYCKVCVCVNSVQKVGGPSVPGWFSEGSTKITYRFEVSKLVKYGHMHVNVNGMYKGCSESRGTLGIVKQHK